MTLLICLQVMDQNILKYYSLYDLNITVVIG